MNLKARHSLCTFASRRAYRVAMESPTDASERFVRIPTSLLEHCFRAPLTGVQLRVVLWVVPKRLTA
jgi:hypothetical protein